MGKISKDKEDRVSVTRMIKFIAGIRKSFLPLVILERLLASAVIYLNIILGAAIIDSITKAIQAGGGDKDEEKVIKLALFLTGLNMVLALARWAAGKWLIILRREIDETVLKMAAEKGFTLDYQILEKPGTLDLLERAQEGSRSNGGITSYCMMIGDIISDITNIIYAVVIITGFFNNSPAFISAAMLLSMGVLVFLRYILSKKVQEQNYKFFDGNIEANRKFGFYFSFLYDYNLGKHIRIYDMAGIIVKGAYSRSGKLAGPYNKLFKEAGRLSVIGVLLEGLALLVCYAFVGIRAVNGDISIGSLTLYVGALTNLTDAVASTFGVSSMLNIQNQYLSGYKKFLLLENEKYSGCLNIKDVESNSYKIEFKNVSFHYPNSDELVLKNINAKISIGNKMAVVGKNGSGKSTFIKLLCRLYDPTEGEILLNGTDIRKYDYDEYRKIFAVVFQDFNLFSFPIAYNVAAGTEYNEEKVWEALEKAGIADRVKEMDKGIETVIYKQEDEGVEISGGEAQKLAVARALYKDAPLVILDEPTAALDPVSEFEIYKRFDGMAGSKTAIYISHRMSSCRFCENILVFDSGNIVQMGSHNELLQQEEGIYAQLWKAQAQYYNAS